MMIRKLHKKNNRNKTDPCLEGWGGGGGDTHFTGNMCTGIYILRKYTYHVTPARLAERAWCTKFQSSLLNVYFRLSGVQASFLLIYFRNGPQ